MVRVLGRYVHDLCPYQFHMPSCDDSLIIANRPKATCIFCVAALCMVTFCKKVTFMKSVCFSKLYRHTSCQDPRLFITPVTPTSQFHVLLQIYVEGIIKYNLKACVVMA